MIHIQNTEPKPPRHRAVEIPMMFPVPTREAVETIRAWNEETEPSLLGFCMTTRMHSRNQRNWIRRVRTVKKRQQDDDQDGIIQYVVHGGE